MNMLECPLTKAEVNIVQLLADNERPKKIAHALGISVYTVHQHIVVSKMRAGIRGASVAHLVAVSIRNGWVQ